jgi:outer membrane protein TolC
MQHGEHTRQATVSVTLATAIDLGSKRGPESTKTRASRKAAEHMATVASPTFTQLPYVQTQVGPRLSNDKLRPEFIVSAVQPFTWGDISGAQRRVANATARVVESTTESARLSDAERAAHAWIDLALAEQLLALRRQFVTQASSLAALAEARVSTGEAQPVERALAQSELSEAQVLVLDAEGTHFESEVELGYRLGVGHGVVVHISGSLTLPEPVPAPLPRRVHPEVTAAESRFHLAHEHVAYAALQQAPIVSLGVQYQREGTGEQILTAIATLPLPVAQPWAFQQAQQQLQSDEAYAETAQARAESSKQHTLAVHEASHARSQYTHMAESSLPPLREAHRLAVVRYSLGESDFASVSIVRQRLLRAEEQLALALANVNHTHVRLQAARGTLLNGAQ